jgi:hypothetical protein
MLGRLLILILSVICLGTAASAKDIIAVLEPTGPLDRSVLMKLSDESRAAAVTTLSKDDYRVITRENMFMILRDMDVDPSCIEGECEVETGRNIGAKYVISGSVINLSDTWILTLKLHETERGSLLGTGEARGATPLELIDQVKGSTQAMLRESIQRGGSATGTSLRVTGAATSMRALDLGDTIVNAPTDKTAFMMVESQPSGAKVIINGQESGDTPYQVELPWGQYKVTVKLPQHHPAQQDVELNSAETQELNFTLLPAYGALSVTSSPSKANVFIDGDLAGKTPLNLTRKPSRTYNVRVERANFHTVEQQVQVVDQETATLHAALSKSVGGATIQTDPAGAVIEINGETVGRTPFQLTNKPPGTYQVRLTKALYLSKDFDFELVAGEQYKQTVTLAPNFGSLTVQSEPSGAAISLSGKTTKKKTPHTFGQIQAGSVTLALSKPGHGTWRGSTQIEVGQTALVNETLSAMLGTVAIKTFLPGNKPCRGEITLDGTPVGRAPLVRQVVATVPHKLHADCDGMAAGRDFTVGHNERVDLELKVANFSARDVVLATKDLEASQSKDFLGMLGSGALGLGSLGGFIASQAKFSASLDLNSAADLDQYSSLRTQGQTMRIVGIGLGAAGIGILYKTIRHKNTTTRKKAAQLEYIMTQHHSR